MRPNTLTIQAFGPFADTQTIEFDRLGANPLFLINGPTGAGKSSILDAICFALYGQTTGKEREATQMRCDHSDASLLTEVSLSFSLGTHQYRVRRSPTQEKPKARGEGTTTHQTEAQLWETDAFGEESLLVPKSASEVTKTIENLTGLNVEQFRQVMVLPQGKFREFLMAESKEREAIFSKLFQTQIYKRLEDALKERASGIRREVETLRNQTVGILRGADLDAEEQLQALLTELAPQLEQAQTQKAETATALSLADKALETASITHKAFEALEKTKADLNALESQSKQIAEQQTTLEHAQSAQKIAYIQTSLAKAKSAETQLLAEIERTQQNIQAQTQLLSEATETFKQAEKAFQTSDALKQQANELKAKLPLVAQHVQAENDLKNKKQIESASAKRLETASQTLLSLRKALEANQTKLTQLRQAIQTLPQHQIDLENLKRLGSQRAKIDTLLKERSRLEQEVSTRTNNLNQAIEQVQTLETQVKTLEFNWHSNQAAMLAAELQQGAPCPVCGSLEHPSPAHLQANNLSQPVTKEQIDQAKITLDAALKAQNQAQSALVETQTHQQNNHQAVTELTHELGDHQFKATDQLRQEYKTLDQQVKTLMSQQSEAQTCEITIADLTQKHAAQEQSLETARARLHNDQQALTIASQTVEHLLVQLPEQFREAGVLETSLKQLEIQIEQLHSNFQSAQTTLNAATQQLTQTQATLAQQNTQKAGLTAETAKAESDWQQALSSSPFIDEKAYQNAARSEQEQTSLQAQINEHAQKMAGCKANLQQQQSQLESQTKPDIGKLQTARTEADQQANKALEDWKRIDNRVRQLQDVQTKIDEAHKANKALEDEYKIYGTLSDVANGQTGNKISLQRFVLSVLLDDVLIEASQRLQAMSKGRYLLIRKEERAKGNKASGLELEVEDAYTGKTRSVATLSGGESFMAALSLALGLSDVVQAYAGGIKLDTLFIDEGFGSLDQESLDLAVKTLIDLQASGRMIGIISHVSELREQMALRVDVKSSASGSTVTVAV
ncbi:SMC family ATPase [Litoribacillus peritrichatus]|uniref:SMC family ATPase n=1 Tax=Litoribacillus peritrichatus TaxID=718191 RepID=A0ABP7ME59_9GAMM